MDERLYRSRTDRMLTGVAGGLAERMNVDPSLVRVVWVLLAFLSGGIFALIYIVMAIVVPERPLEAGRPAPSSVPPTEAPPGSWVGPDGRPVPMAPDTPGTATEGQEGQQVRRPGSGAVVVGGILILLGLWFLAVRYVPWLDVSTIWPVAVIAIGVFLVALAVMRPSGR